MSDGTVQAPADNLGKLVDADEQTIAGNTVERLRVEIPDEIRVNGEILELLLAEIKLTNVLLAQAFGLSSSTEIELNAD